MRTRLDENPCPFDSSSVGDAIDQGAALAREQGRLVIEVIVDGTNLTPEQIDSAECRAAAASDVQLLSTDAHTLVRQTLGDASTALIEVDERQRSAAECLQTGARTDAMEHLGTAVGLWISVQEAVLGCAQALGLDLDALSLNESEGGSVRTRIQELEQRLIELRAALQNDDSIGLADTLMYDLPQVVTDWQEVLATMQTQIAGEPDVEPKPNAESEVLRRA